jgi:hypothetical protein
VKFHVSAQILRKESGRKVSAQDLPVMARSVRAALGNYLALLESDIAAGNVEELLGGET